MHLIILCASYSQAWNFISHNFPMRRPNENMDILIISDERDLDRLLGIGRGQVYIMLGGSQRMVDFCRARGHVQVTVVEER